METIEISSEVRWISPKKYFVNLFLYIILPCSAIFTAINLYIQMTKTEPIQFILCKEMFIGDGHCQDAYNIAACQFDLGDCCLPDPATKQLCNYCTCFEKFGIVAAITKSPQNWEFTANLDCPNFEFVGDGFCDDITNNYICGYDGGDCCLNFIYILFCSDCVCHCEKDKYQSEEICRPVDRIGNLECNDEANLQACNYDGGDCCLGHVNRDFCQICICHEDLKQHPQIICPSKNAIANHICDPVNNLTECNYDGGDCIDVVHNRYAIVHTTTNKFMMTEEETTTLGIFQSHCKMSSQVGDGFCQDDTNIDVCDYDGGDCCQPSAKGLNCIFCICHMTNSSHVLDIFVSSCVHHEYSPHNGICDDKLNIPGCNFDLGDCCGGILIKCDKCLCHEDFPDCWFFTWIKDGVCDDLANNDICGYDGGDCCLDTIDSTFCKECICHDDNTRHLAYDIPPCRLQDEMGDRICQDELNTESCSFDLGDCCKDIIIDYSCKLCICHEDLQRHMGFTSLADSCFVFQVKDGYCDDNNNKAECVYDGGDCCLPVIHGFNCNICICKEDNTKHPKVD